MHKAYCCCSYEDCLHLSALRTVLESRGRIITMGQDDCGVFFGWEPLPDEYGRVDVNELILANPRRSADPRTVAYLDEVIEAQIDARKNCINRCVVCFIDDDAVKCVVECDGCGRQFRCHTAPACYSVKSCPWCR